MKVVFSFAGKAGLACAALVLSIGAPGPGSAKDRDKPASGAQMTITGFPADCKVELDASRVATTDRQETIELEGIEPGEHYVHVACPGQTQQAFFISPKPGETANIRPQPPRPAPSALEAAETHRELRRLVQAAVDARNAGKADEAISDLRRASLLDPENADLHRELGITFLLLRDWARARVEYLEAIRHDPGEAESHNGLGYALSKLGDPKGAAREFHSAMTLDPDDTNYQEHYVEALAELDAQQERAKKKR